MSRTAPPTLPVAPVIARRIFSATYPTSSKITKASVPFTSMLSNLSSMPPCPGIIFPVSLTPGLALEHRLPEVAELSGYSAEKAEQQQRKRREGKYQREQAAAHKARRSSARKALPGLMRADLAAERRSAEMAAR